MNGQGLTLFHSRLSTALVPKGFNPANIIAIIQAIVKLVGGCPAPTPASLKARRPAQTAMLALEAASNDDTLTIAQAFFGLAEAKRLANEATDGENESFIADCQ